MNSPPPITSEPTELFRYAIEAMQDALYVLDEMGNIIFFNGSAAASFSQSDNTIGNPLFGPPWNLIKEDGSPVLDRQMPIAHALRTRQPIQETLGVNKPGDEIRWVAVHIVPIRRPGDTVCSMALVTLRDITEEKRAKDALRQREEYYRSLIENSYDIITVLDKEGIICFESPSIHRILGYTPTELLGKQAFDYVHPDDRARVLAAFRTRVQNPETRQATKYRALHRNGTWVTFETVSTTQTTDNRTRIILNSREILESK